ncbi:UNVERIFIED_CONTAM: hypothetical protein GTU68_044528 [Idotea baltica]|nr:hypothetical protein [Idotea baltica]
MFRVKSILR